MSKLRWSMVILMLFAVLLAACAPAATPTPTPRPTQAPTDVPAEEEETEVAAEETEAVEEEATEVVAEAETEEAAETEAAEEEATEEAAETEVVEEEATQEATEVAMEPTAVETEEEAVETEVVEEEMTEEATEAAAEATEEAALETEVPVAGGAAGDVTVAAGGDVTLGLAVALSGEGLAPLGIDIQRGAEIALSERPTVTVDGEEFNVVLDSQDDLCSAEGGQAVANRFVADENVVAVVGPMCSSACRSAQPIFDAANFTTISPSCTYAPLTTSGSTSFNRVVLSDGIQGLIAAEFIYNNLGIHRIATIHDGSTYGEGLVSVMSQHFEELGGEIVAAEAVTVGDTDFRSLLEDIAREEPELVYFAGFPAEGARLAEQRGDADLEDIVFMGGDGLRTQESIDLAGEAAEGAYASTSIPAPGGDLDAFLSTYEETYGEEPPGPFHAHGYDATNVLLNAIEATGSLDDDGNLVISRDAIREYVRSLEGYQGLVGVLTNNGSGEMVITDIGISQVRDGEFVPLAIGHITDSGEIVITDAPAEEEVATEEAAETEVAEDNADAENADNAEADNADAENADNAEATEAA